MISNLLLRDGVFHAPSHPFATALRIEDDTVTWMGDEDTATIIASHSDGLQSDGLNGALVAPGFVDIAFPAESPASLPANARELGVTSVIEIEANRFIDARGGVDAANSVIEYLLSQSAGPADIRRRRLVIAITDGLSDAAIAQFSTWAVTLVIDGAERPERAAALRALTREGVATILRRSTDANPWDVVRAAIYAAELASMPGAGVSARAAFRAMTRAPWRIVDGNCGELALGAPADLVAWRGTELGIESPLESITSWSADSRAGSPLLPIVGVSGILPQATKYFSRSAA